MLVSEYESYDAVGLAELVAQGQVSPSELLACAIEQIERYDGKIHAVIARWFDRAEQRIASGLSKGPFTGVPMLLKDDLPLAGTRMSLGSRFLKDEYCCPQSHPVAERIESAGFVLLGRTNMSELGLLPTTEPDCYGPTHNPWDLERSTGGSSGGSAAAVAARMVPIAQSSDGGGSARIPASACGLVGLKPSRGRVPSLLDVDGAEGFIVRSAMTRTLRDSATFLDAIAGAFGFERWVLPVPRRSFRACTETDPERLRIGFATKDSCNLEAHAECRNAVERTARLLEALGHFVEPAQPRFDGSAFNESFVVLWAMCAGFCFRQVRATIGERLHPRIESLARNPFVFNGLTRLAQHSGIRDAPFESFTRRLARLDVHYSPSDLWAAWCVMQQADRAFAEFFKSYDLLLCPVLGQPPWKLGFFRQDWSDDELREHLFPYLGQTHVINTVGLPAISLPLYWTSEGLPIGIQLVAPWGREDWLLGIGAELERVAPWEGRRPSVDNLR